MDQCYAVVTWPSRDSVSAGPALVPAVTAEEPTFWKLRSYVKLPNGTTTMTAFSIHKPLDALPMQMKNFRIGKMQFGRYNLIVKPKNITLGNDVFHVDIFNRRINVGKQAEDAPEPEHGCLGRRFQPIGTKLLVKQVCDILVDFLQSVFIFTDVEEGSYIIKLSTSASVEIEIDAVDVIGDATTDLAEHRNKDIELLNIPVGDVSGDGKIDINDVGEVLLEENYGKNAPACDINMDGVADIADITIILAVDNFAATSKAVNY